MQPNIQQARRQKIRQHSIITASVLLTVALPGICQIQRHTSVLEKLNPHPAIPAILSTFDKYEIVGMSEAHGKKDVDDLILALIRTPGFSEKVNDIAVECGNSLYQPILDRYIDGQDVPFTEVRKVWRNKTQPMCNESGFFEQFFPLVRAINQKLPAGKRLRVLAGDPPIDWDQIKSAEDFSKFIDRDANIASVMKKEVLSKHRKALMLFGIFHLMHGAGVGLGNAVTIYEKDYPNSTFVIDDLGIFDTNLPLSASPFAGWSSPSLVLTKGTWLGALDLGHFSPATVWADEECKVHNEFPRNEQKPIEELVDAFLYLGPQDLLLAEQMPADIALDSNYMAETLRRAALVGVPGAKNLNQQNQQIMDGAKEVVRTTSKMPDPKVFFPLIEQTCLVHKHSGGNVH